MSTVRPETQRVIAQLHSVLREDDAAIETAIREFAEPYIASLREELAVMEGAVALLSQGRDPASRQRRGGGQQPLDVPRGLDLAQMADELRRMNGKQAVLVVLFEQRAEPIPASTVITRLSELGHPTASENVRSQLSRAARPARGVPLVRLDKGRWSLTEAGREVARGLIPADLLISVHD